MSPLIPRVLALALALTAVAAAGKIPASRTPISRDLYHSSDSFLREMKALVARHSDKLSMDTIRASNRGYSAELFVVTFNHMKENADNGSKVHVFLSFGQHRRELITSEVALRLLYILTEKRTIAGVDLTSFEKMLENLVIKDYDPYEENPGFAPFSEPEAQIMRELSRSFKPHIWVNVHSGMEALFMPYDHKNTTPNGASAHLMRYLAHGTTTDYMYGIGKVPMAYTFEIYGDETASNEDCFKMFNPVDKTTFDRVINKWCMAFLILFEEGLQNLRDAQVISQGPLDNWVPIGGDMVEKSVAQKSGRESIDLGMQELRTYFRPDAHKGLRKILHYSRSRSSWEIAFADAENEDFAVAEEAGLPTTTPPSTDGTSRRRESSIAGEGCRHQTPHCPCRRHRLPPQETREPAITQSHRKITGASVPSAPDPSTFHGWADLPEGLLHSIIPLLGSFLDLLAFAASCSSWHAAFASYPHKSAFRTLLPPLPVRPNVRVSAPHLPSSRDGHKLRTCQVIDPANPNIALRCQIPQENLQMKHFAGFSYGKLICGRHRDCLIVDVFTGVRVSPPQLPFSEDPFFYCGMLTAPLSPMAVHTAVSTPCLIGLLEVILGQNCGLMMHALIRLWTSMVSSSRWTDYHQRLCSVSLFRNLGLQEIATVWWDGMSECPFLRPWLVVCGDMLLIVDHYVSFSFGAPVIYKAYCLNMLTNPATWWRWRSWKITRSLLVLMSGALRFLALALVDGEGGATRVGSSTGKRNERR
ncbi:hypothetical protein EJB05_46715 [Eragrostis curvula]|uniref:Peptidase M14 domain-containing protein n=1 Tax=Eragrostis curvula TaxID=38414 RepID=A0A5J9TP27_9POAL|nr:hypothetical protein EJB05_46715 [Eragrostis curvula]